MGDAVLASRLRRVRTPLAFRAGGRPSRLHSYFPLGNTPASATLTMGLLTPWHVLEEDTHGGCE